MASIDLYGTPSQYINFTDGYSYGTEIKDTTIEYAFPDSVGWSSLVNFDGWRRVSYFIKGSFYAKSDGNLGGIATSVNLQSDDGYFSSYIEGVNVSVESLIEEGEEWWMTTLAGDDNLDGSIDGGSVKARLMDGNDQATISSGLFNDVNGNRGEDKFFLEGGSGMIRGGKDNDWIQVEGGQWDHVNGNNGDDYIINYSDFAGNIYGGKDDDLLVNADGGGYFYGNLGADTFKPYANGTMFVKDFEVGIDSLDLSALGSYNTVYSEGDTLIGSVTTGELALVVEGVIL